METAKVNNYATGVPGAFLKRAMGVVIRKRLYEGTAKKLLYSVQLELEARTAYNLDSSTRWKSQALDT
jgi:hypothetical protein